MCEQQKSRGLLVPVPACGAPEVRRPTENGEAARDPELETRVESADASGWGAGGRDCGFSRESHHRAAGQTVRHRRGRGLRGRPDPQQTPGVRLPWGTLRPACRASDGLHDAHPRHPDVAQERGWGTQKSPKEAFTSLDQTEVTRP